MRIPLPSCYFAENDDSKHIVIDGVQRITTIMKFFNDEFSLEGLTTFKELEGKKFSQLKGLRSELEATTIRCIVLRKENPKKLIREIFSRLNQGAVKLSDQEIRHALYPGVMNDLLKKLADTSEIKNFGMGLSGEKIKDSLEGEEQVLRFFAFKEDIAEYGNNLKEFLDLYMEKKSSITEKEAKAKEKSFIDALRKCKAVFGEDIFIDMNKTRRRQGMVYYDLLMQTLVEYDIDSLIRNRLRVVSAYKRLCASNEFKRTTSGGLQMKSSIAKRTELWTDLLEEAVG
jgi:uncharacterized protein with ParB-like and HNH nuclease domain